MILNRPVVVAVAAVLLGVCAALQLAVFVADGAGFPLALFGFAGFAAAAGWVWRGLRGARMLTWIVVVLAAPLYVGYATGHPLPFAVGAVALAAALVLVVLPPANAYFRALRGARQPEV